MNIVAFAGGVGGAKLVDGLSRVFPAEKLTIIVNTGDDFEHLGLKICPDLDTVCYTLAGLANPSTGWGRENETWNALDSLARLGGPDWFHVGDKDLGTHLERTRRLRNGEPLSQVTRDFCARWGIRPTVLPMTDDPLATWVETVEAGLLPFQEYFVRQAFRPTVKGFQFRGCETAEMAPGVKEAILAADGLVFCPSNPWVSIRPILEVQGVRDAMRGIPVVAVSPIVGGEAIKGPAAKMFRELGEEPSALAVAKLYTDWLSGFVLDIQDGDMQGRIEKLGSRVLVTNTIMNSTADRKQLAVEISGFLREIIGK